MMPVMVTLLSLISFGVVMFVTPGPNNIMLWASGANFGLKRTLPHLFGVATGFGSLMLVTALGLGALFERFPIIQTSLKVLGSLYLLYLAYRLTVAKMRDSEQSARPVSFLEAVGFQYANPKVWVIALTAASTFVLVESFVLNAVLLALTLMVINLPCISVWAVFGSAMSQFLQNPRRMKVFNGVMAGLLVGTVVLLVR